MLRNDQRQGASSGGRGTIGYIKAGDNYTLWVYLRNSEGQVRYQDQGAGGIVPELLAAVQVDMQAAGSEITPVERAGA